DHLSGKTADKVLAHPSREREAVDHNRAVLVEHGYQVAHEPRRMDRAVSVKLLCVFGDLALEIRADLGQLLEPLRAAVAGKVELEFLDAIDHLAQHELRIADHRHFRRHLPSDPVRGGIDLDVFSLVVPGLWSSEMLAAPEAETQGKHDVGATGERLFECSAN